MSCGHEWTDGHQVILRALPTSPGRALIRFNSSQMQARTGMGTQALIHTTATMPGVKQLSFDLKRPTKNDFNPNDKQVV